MTAPTPDTSPPATQTTAPWRIIKQSETYGEAYIIGSDDRPIIATIASTVDDDSEFVAVEDRLNASLIAAAPELLTELKKAHEIIHQFWEMACEHGISDEAEWPFMREYERGLLIQKASTPTIIDA